MSCVGFVWFCALRSYIANWNSGVAMHKYIGFVIPSPQIVSRHMEDVGRRWKTLLEDVGKPREIAWKTCF